jgi:hypothetical protein
MLLGEQIPRSASGVPVGVAGEQGLSGNRLIERREIVCAERHAAIVPFISSRV